MKKSMIAVACIALLALNALMVLGTVDFSSTPTGAVVITGPQLRSNLPSPSYGRMPQIRETPGCHTKVTVDSRDARFIGKAREQCLMNNRLNIFCQRRCFDQINLLLRGTGAGRRRDLYASVSCKALTMNDLAKSTPTACYFDVHSLCQQANAKIEAGSFDFCRIKCVQTSYHLCRALYPRYG